MPFILLDGEVWFVQWRDDNLRKFPNSDYATKVSHWPPTDFNSYYEKAPF